MDSLTDSITEGMDIETKIKEYYTDSVAATAKGIQGGLEKATITNLDTKEIIPCMFCPKQYTIAKSNSWTRGEGTGIGLSTSELQFSTGQPTTLTIELFFDTYEIKKDVRREYTESIWNLMMVPPDIPFLCDFKTHKGRPPYCEFRWGKTWSFKAVITNISQQFTLFLPDGTPVRATLNVTFQQVEDKHIFPRQNPTTGGGYGYRTHLIREGETIDWIAYKAYGDSSLWRFLADKNKLDNPMKLKAGQMLTIVPLS